MHNLLKRKILYFFRSWKILNIFPRILIATTYFNYKYLQILHWSINSKEDTNYTYELTERNIAYLAQTLSYITKTSFTDVMKYINEALHNKYLKNHVLKMMRENPSENTTDERLNFGRRLGWYVLARIVKPKVIVETGVDKGYGAILLCDSLIKNEREGHSGHYYGTDINPSAGYLLSGKYKRYGTILYEDSITTLKKLNVKIDLFIHDSDHSPEYEYNEFCTIYSKLSSKAILLSDNSHESDSLSKFSRIYKRHFLFFHEEPKNHWYPGAGLGISFTDRL